MASDGSLMEQIVQANIIISVLVVLIFLPLALGRIRMNKLYGIRFRKAYRSKRHWYAINRYGGRRMVVAGIMLAVASPALLFLPDADQDTVSIMAGLLSIGFIVLPLVATALWSRRLR